MNCEAAELANEAASAGVQPMNTLRLALVMLRRDWRAGELSVLFAALVLAVASVGTVGFFTDRVKGALTRQANVLLGADLLLSGDRPLPEDFAREARARADSLSCPAIRFNSMVQPDERRGRGDAVLADVKAVGAGLSVARRDHSRATRPIPRAASQMAFPRPARCGSMLALPRGSMCTKARGSSSARRR